MTRPLRTAALLALALAACDEPSLGTSTAWEADIANLGGSTVTGTLNSVSRGQIIESHLNLSGSTEGAVHPWRIRTGPCAGGGTLVGGRASYPDGVADEDGDVVLASTANAVLEPGRTYHVDVLRGVGSDTTLVACGRLDQV
ncbi:MAG TPA: hypothetical protein VFQ45_01105 [Longimicrobium sp.]|nr:hypothetical protein [Longimicrobium sp.]